MVQVWPCALECACVLAERKTCATCSISCMGPLFLTLQLAPRQSLSRYAISPCIGIATHNRYVNVSNHPCSIRPPPSLQLAVVRPRNRDRCRSCPRPCLKTDIGPPKPDRSIAIRQTKTNSKPSWV
ncbi:hypothetical protein BJX96DRAFT_89879 [Aspergillus floccosus]